MVGHRIDESQPLLRWQPWHLSVLGLQPKESVRRGQNIFDLTALSELPVHSDVYLLNGPLLCLAIDHDFSELDSEGVYQINAAFRSWSASWMGKLCADNLIDYSVET